MRLLYLTDRLSHRGGAPNHLLDVLRGMADQHSVTVASAGMDKDVRLPRGVEHMKVSGLRSGKAQEQGLSRLPGLIENSDLIHLQNVMNPTAIHMAKTRPCIVTIQDHRVFCPGPGRTVPDGQRCTEKMQEAPCGECIPQTEQREHMMELTLARQEALQDVPMIVLSAYMADEMELAGFTRPAVIPPSIKMGPPKDDPGFGFLIAGRLVHHKGIDMGHQAWMQANTEHPLRVAGLGPASEQLPGADLLGWLDADALRNQLRSARALLFPSRWQEPYGILGVEALAMGTPVIAMECGGMGDWAETGTIAIKPGDVQGMKAAIQSMAQQPQMALNMGRAGQNMMRHQQETREPMSTLQKLYRGTVQNKMH